MRRIPATMATQHPDNAQAPFWDAGGDPFIGTEKEMQDLLVSFQQLGADEFMWDWEGKYADASIIEKLYGAAGDYFSEHPLGKSRFLTFRIPNLWEEKGYSLMQALSVILAAEDYARDLGIKKRPLFEMILPMTQSADQLMHMHHLYDQLAEFKNTVFTREGADNTDRIELIPLVESVSSQQAMGDLLDTYVAAHMKKYKKKPEYIRPFIACSDPALMSGWLSTILANKNALSQMYAFSKKHKIPVFPIAGAGSLPFRGGLSPATAERFTDIYAGLRTVSVQSSFRYDHPTKEVKEAIKYLQKTLPKTKPQIYDKKTTETLEAITAKSERHYQKTLAKLIPDMRVLFEAVPKRRARRLHVGLLAYGRKVNKMQMPRAIKFTSSFYSLGVPPEFIGLGRALRDLTDEETKILQDILPQLKDLVTQAGVYINHDNLKKLAARNKGWNDVIKDIELVEEFLGLSFAPKTLAQKSHINATANVLLMKNNPKHLERAITEAALLRKSLG